MGEVFVPIDHNIDISIESDDKYIFLKLGTYDRVLSFDPRQFMIYRGRENFEIEWDLETLENLKIEWDWVPSFSKRGVYIYPKTYSTPYTWHTMLQKLPSINQKSPVIKLIGRWQNYTNNLNDIDFQVSLDEVQHIFAKSCSCHQTDEASDQWYHLQVAHFPLPSLADPSMPILKLYEPSQSMLFLKVLRDFPIQGPAMPPDSTQKLTTDELWTIERWILQGIPQ